MTSAADHNDPDPVAAGFPKLGLPALQELIQQAAEQVQSTEPADGSTGAELIDRIAELETLQNSLAALQSATVRLFARTHAAAATRGGTVEPEKLERSIAQQIGSACGVSVTEGRRRLRVARDLHEGLDRMRGLFTSGQLNSHKITTVVTATSDLDAAERAEVDRLLAAGGLRGLGVGGLRTRARTLVAQVAPAKFLARCTAARSNRRVTLRPAADGMTDLTAHLPAEQGAACLAALHRAFNTASVDPAPMTRSRGQLMADTLVERLTGQATAEAVNVEVQIVIPLEALVDPDSPLPAEIPGHGPVPAGLLTTLTGEKTWRRLITRDGLVFGGSTKQRGFTKILDVLIRARDQHRCTEPFCDSPIREADHIHRHSDGGPSDFWNARGTCKFHNLLREQPGWNVERTPAGIRTTTPTGHSYFAPNSRRTTS